MEGTIEPLRLGGLELDPPLVLAPLAGYTVPPFRALCFRLGASLAFTEMVSAAGLIKSGRRSFPLLERDPGEGPLGVQLFGSDPELVAGAAALMAPLGFQVVDLNFACPVPKVTGAGAGAALMRDPARALALVAAVKEATPLPVTVKLRLGWERESVGPLLPRLAEAGAAALTLHGRTREQGYRGRADWEAITRCHRVLGGRVPLLGSGDLFTPRRCLQVLAEARCDGIQLARGALNNPWLFRQVGRLLAGVDPGGVEPGEKRRAAGEILDWLVARKGEKGGVQAFRGFFSRLVKGQAGARELRRRIYRVEDLAGAGVVMDRAFAPPPVGEATPDRPSPA